ncbi:MAG: Pycsar system effector family protein [Saprospiraceae bacterium]
MMEQNAPKTKKAGRGKETLFRVTFSHQSKLIQIADYKANIIINISTMIISAIIAIIGYGAIAGRVQSYEIKLIVPLILIIMSCLIALILAIQAARPKLIRTNYNDDPSHRSSLLFFGVIAGHSLQEYLLKIKELLLSDEEVYEQMIIDMYNQGLVLKRKYNLLVYAFQVLMLGFVVSVAAFLILLST